MPTDAGVPTSRARSRGQPSDLRGAHSGQWRCDPGHQWRVDSLVRGGLEPCARLVAVKVTHAATNVADLLSRAAERTPDKLALLETSTVGQSAAESAVKVTTWRELDDQVTAVARGLTRLGVVGGQRVGLCLTNSAAFVTAYFAVLRGGMVAVPLNPVSSPDEIARMLTDSGSRVCFADETTIEAVRAAVGQVGSPLGVITLGVPAADGETPYADLAVEGGAVLPPRDRESLAVLLYTSGTSGRPVGPCSVIVPCWRTSTRPHRRGQRRSNPMTSCSGCFRCRTSTASTPCSARCCCMGHPCCSDRASTRPTPLRLVGATQGHRAARRPAGDRVLAAA